MLIIAAIAAIGPSITSRAERLNFSPESCAQDAQGMVYVALDRSVFRFPAQELTTILDLSPERRAKAPPRPDPSEPEGCPGNPIRGAAFSFAYAYRALQQDKRDPRLPTGAPDRLRLIATYAGEWGTQLSAEARFSRLCEQYRDREDLPNGLVACFARTKEAKEKNSDWSVSYQAKEELYNTPLSRPFVVDCLAGLDGRAQPCRVVYKLTDNLRVVYEFRPRLVPIDSVIGFDRGLRERIETARVADFIWPDEAETTRPTRKGIDR